MPCTVTVTFELNANAPDHAWMVVYSYLKGKGVRRKDEATDGFERLGAKRNDRHMTKYVLNGERYVCSTASYGCAWRPWTSRSRLNPRRGRERRRRSAERRPNESEPALAPRFGSMKTVEIGDGEGKPTIEEQEGRRRRGELSPKTVCIIAALREELSTKEIVNKCRCAASDVYYAKNRYKDRIEYGLPPAPEPEKEDGAEDSDALSEETIEQIQDMRDEGLSTTEIADELALSFDAVPKVPARNAKR